MNIAYRWFARCDVILLLLCTWNIRLQSAAVAAAVYQVDTRTPAPIPTIPREKEAAAPPDYKQDMHTTQSGQKVRKAETAVPRKSDGGRGGGVWRAGSGYPFGHASTSTWDAPSVVRSLKRGHGCMVQEHLRGENMTGKECTEKNSSMIPQVPGMTENETRHQEPALLPSGMAGGIRGTEDELRCAFLCNSPQEGLQPTGAARIHKTRQGAARSLARFTMQSAGFSQSSSRACSTRGKGHFLKGWMNDAGRRRKNSEKFRVAGRPRCPRPGEEKCEIHHSPREVRIP